MNEEESRLVDTILEVFALTIRSESPKEWVLEAIFQLKQQLMSPVVLSPGSIRTIGDRLYSLARIMETPPDKCMELLKELYREDKEVENDE